MTEPIFREVEHLMGALRHHLPHHGYHQPNPTPEAPVSIITAIESDLSAAGHAVDDALHGVLARHLTAVTMLAHVSQWAAAAEASPLLQTVERLALGPAGEAALANAVKDLAGFFAGPGNMQAGMPAPADVPAAAAMPGDPGEPVPAGPVVGGQAQ